MATDATGTPTSNGIPTFQTNVDKPSGAGSNAQMSSIDTLISSALKTVWKKAGTIVGTRRGLNLIEGTGITLTAVDNPGSDQVDLTVTTTIPTPGMVLICDSVLGGSGTFDTNTILGGNIPQTYKHLRLVLNARDTAAATGSGVFGRINNDSGANQYTYAYQRDSGTTHYTVDTQQDTKALFGSSVGSLGNAGLVGQTELVILDYASTTFNKRWKGDWAIMFGTSAGNWESGTVGGFWNSTAAITRLALTNTFAAGSRFTLYGLT